METAAAPDSQSPAPAKPARGTRPPRGAELDLRIDDLAHGGRGVARHDGFVVFVAGGLPGDRVRARVAKSKRGYAEATAIELIEPSPNRIADTCVHDGESCPGAAWQGLSYEDQLEHKQRQVSEALTRIGGLEGIQLDDIVGAGDADDDRWRYRNKLEYSFGDRGGDAVIGFHKRGSWSEIVSVDDCKLASDANNAARNSIRDWAVAEGLPAYDADADMGVLRNLIVRDSARTGQTQTRLVTSPASFPKPPVDLHTVIDGPSGGTDGPTGVLGDEYLEEELCDLRFQISSPAFFQTNTRMAERLYAIAAERAALTGSERLFDLYCGIGTIGLTMASQAREVWGIESVEAAVADAERNAARNGITNARFVAADARVGLRPLIERAGKPDVVVIDPPRAGLSAKVCRRLLECEAKRIVYVSCNPTTLAPNAAQLVEAGYTLERVTPVDMFPQTPHMEAVAVFNR